MRTGLVGAGKIGQLRARSIKEDTSTELTGVFDLRADLAKQAAAGSGAKVCGSLQELLDLPLDALVVSTPVHVHDDA
ncbi:MAG: Gfo/Idh/MocA family oxidoreductase, partial [Gemmatimonadaceae bacterium]